MNRTIKNVLITLMWMTGVAQAVPVLNENFAFGERMFTFWKDSQDPTIFWYAPSSLQISCKSNRCFNYTKTKVNGERGYLINSIVKPVHNLAAFEESKDIILRDINSKAKFAPIPFLSSKIVLDETQNLFVMVNGCSHDSSQAGDEIPCNFILNKRGDKTYRPLWFDGGVVPFQYYYSFTAVNKDGVGAIGPLINVEYKIVVRFGGMTTKDNEMLKPRIFDDLYSDASVD